MPKIVGDKLLFEEQPLLYCHRCKTEMSFDGHVYECPICGSIFKEKGIA